MKPIRRISTRQLRTNLGVSVIAGRTNARVSVIARRTNARVFVFAGRTNAQVSVLAGQTNAQVSVIARRTNRLVPEMNWLRRGNLLIMTLIPQVYILAGVYPELVKGILPS